MRKIQKFRQEKIVPISREEVWNILSDTNHLNRVLGLPVANYGVVIEGKSGVHRTAVTTIMKRIKIHWKEYPFQFKRGDYYNNLREYENGPIKSILTLIELYDDDEIQPDGSRGTKLIVGADMLSSNWIGDLLIPLVVRSSFKKMFDYTTEFLRLRNEGRIHPIPQSKPEFEVNLAELDRLMQELAKLSVNPSHLPLLRAHLAQDGDDEVIDMRPYQWANIWDQDRIDTLRTFLYATNVGILNLGWHLLCPNCRVSKSNSDTLRQAAESYHCDLCGIEFATSLDKYMELCFSVHPSIRKAYKTLFCIGGPAITPHIHLQSFVRSNEPVELIIPEHLANFRMRVLKSNKSIQCVNSAVKPQKAGEAEGMSGGVAGGASGGVAGGASGDTPAQPMPKTLLSHIVTYRTDGINGDGWSVDRLEFDETRRSVIIENEADHDIVVVFEKGEWEDITVTVAQVSSMNEFRRMFSSEVFAPGHDVGIENVTFFFSDLLGSTVFYEEVGDGPAYGQVRKHFDFLTQWIHENNGSIVKTIGDAVMAVFEQPEHGIKAALDIQANVGHFNDSIGDGKPIVIKIGIHSGAAIAVNSNDRIDYFGRNVNISARVQGLSKGNDIVVSGVSCERPQVVELLRRPDIEMHEFEAELRGIEEKQSVYQIRVIS